MEERRTGERDLYDILESIFTAPLSVRPIPLPMGFDLGENQIKVTRLYECGSLVIVHALFSKDNLYPFHNHDDSAEHFVCIKGKLKLTIRQHNLDGTSYFEDKILTPTECLTIGIGLEHECLALEDSEVVAICIPPEIAYCKVSNGRA